MLKTIDRSPTKVCVVGLGYIGLTTAAVLADSGYVVHGVDIQRNVVDQINDGRIHIHEPGLGELVKRVVGPGQLRASLSPCEADVFMICVPTPIKPDRTPDLTFVEQACRAIRPLVRRDNLVVLESTSPLGTTESIVAKHAVPPELEIGSDLFVAYCPERVLPGRMLTEVIENDRVVGGITSACSVVAAGFYRSFVRGTVHQTTAVTAEMVKLTENAYRDVNIAFANELSILSCRFGVDPFEVIELSNRHPRVNILNPGPGVGGHCISVDPWFLAHAAPHATPLIQAARRVNDRKPHVVVEQVEALVREHSIETIGCLGLTYKSGVDDLRESPSLEIVRQLRRRQIAELLVCDPYVAPPKFDEFPLHALHEVVRCSDMLLLLTDHQVFRDLPSEALGDKVIVDTRGIWRGKVLAQQSAQADKPLSRRVAA